MIQNDTAQSKWRHDFHVFEILFLRALNWGKLNPEKWSAVFSITIYWLQGNKKSMC